MKNLSHRILTSLITLSAFATQAKPDIDPISQKLCNSVQGRVTQLGGCNISRNTDSAKIGNKAIIYQIGTSVCLVMDGKGIRDGNETNEIFKYNTSCNILIKKIKEARGV